MTRGIAKKAYTYGRRNNMDMVAISKFVEDAVNSYNKMTPEMEQAIKEIVEFKYSDDSDKSVENELNVNADNKDAASPKPVESNESLLFDIKKLNDINDKMIRGSLKKIYMAGKRNKSTTSEVIAEMFKYLNDNDIMNDDLKSILGEIDSSAYDDNQNTGDDVKTDNNLFDIKELNSIEDKVIRGTSKKIFMAGKRAGKNSEQVISDIIDELKNSGKINEEIEQFLNKIK